MNNDRQWSDRDKIAAYLFGCVYPPNPIAAYPRTQWERPLPRLPLDTLMAAAIPAGVRLEFRSNASAIKIRFRQIEANPLLADFIALNKQLRMDFIQNFELWTTLAAIDVKAVNENCTSVEFTLPAWGGNFIVYLPELIPLELLSIEAVGGELGKASNNPRWLAYGDSITEGWSASCSAHTWPNRLSRSVGLDLINFGYGGSARGEIAVAESIAELDADIISISYGTNCWSRVPHSISQFREGLEAFLDIVRQGHRTTPLLAISPILRPDAEVQANKLGACLGDLRAVFEQVVQGRRDAGDQNLYRIDGLHLISESELCDGIHPGDQGHALLADKLSDSFNTVKETL